MKFQAPTSKLQRSTKHQISLTPGFSRVLRAEKNGNRFNGFPCAGGKPLKRFLSSGAVHTGLKPGVNENAAFTWSLNVLWMPARDASELELGIWSFNL